MAGATLRDILGDSRSAKCCILQYKIVSKIGPGRSPKRRARDDNSCSDYRLQALSPEILSLKISWQAQYLVKLELEGDFACSTNWK